MKNERNTKTGNSLRKLKKNAAQNEKSGKKAKSNAKVQKYARLGGITAAAIAVLTLVCIVTVSLLNDAGAIIRAKSVSKSDDLKINGAMMSYLFWDSFHTSLSGDYATYYKLQGIASPEDLEKENPNEKGTTWKDHFFKMACETTKAMLDYAQYALDNGRGLTSEDQKLIEEELENIENTAFILGYKADEYIEKNYGRGVNMSDVRDVLELICLSNNGMILADEKLAPTEDDLNNYYNTNTNELKKADYYFFVLGISGKDVLTPEQEQYYSEKALYISQSSSTEEFKEKVTEYLKEQNELLKDGDENKLDKDELEAAIKAELKALEYTADVYADKEDVDKWIFSDERFEGDTYINHHDGFGTYGVAYIVKPVYIDSEWKEIAKKNIVKERTSELIEEYEIIYPVELDKFGKSIPDLV